MYTTGQGKARLGVVKIAYEVTHPVEEERDPWPHLCGRMGRKWSELETAGGFFCSTLSHTDL
jgi:hypothetical protein